MNFTDIFEGLHKTANLIFEASTTLNSDESNKHESHVEFKESVNELKFSLQTVWQQVSHHFPVGLIDYANPNPDKLEGLGLDPIALVSSAFTDNNINPVILEDSATFLSDTNHHCLITSKNADEINAAAQKARDLQQQLTI